MQAEKLARSWELGRLLPRHIHIERAGHDLTGALHLNPHAVSPRRRKRIRDRHRASANRTMLLRCGSVPSNFCSAAIEMLPDGCRCANTEPSSVRRRQRGRACPCKARAAPAIHRRSVATKVSSRSSPATSGVAALPLDRHARRSDERRRRGFGDRRAGEPRVVRIRAAPRRQADRRASRWRRASARSRSRGRCRRRRGSGQAAAAAASTSKSSARRRARHRMQVRERVERGSRTRNRCISLP